MERGGRGRARAFVNGRLLIRSFLSLLVSNIVGQAFTLWAIVHLAATLGTAQFGNFSFAQIVGLYGFYLADFGLSIYGSRLVAHDGGKLREHVRNLTWLKLALAGACYAVIAGVAFATPDAGGVRSLILIHGLVVFPAALSLEWVYQGLEHMDVVGISRVLKGVVFGVLVVALVSAPEHVALASAFYVGGMGAASAALFVIFLRKHGWPAGMPSRSSLVALLSTAAPLAAGVFVYQINVNFGTFALGVLSTSDSVGVFSSAYKIVLFMSGFVVIAAANATFPQMVQAYARSTAQFREIVGKLLRFFALFSFPIGVGGGLLASRIIGLLYPPQYADSVIVLQVAIWAIVLMMFRVVVENALLASGARRQYMLGYASAGVVTIAGNLALVPSLGILAPAVVAVAAESLLLARFIATCRFIRFREAAATAVRPLAAALLMGGVLAFIPLGLFASLALGAAAYAVFALMLGVVSPGDIRGYLAMVRQRVS
jgi:O-antigen/teichoic acid export membrane protein